MAGMVYAGGRRVEKPGDRIGDGEPLSVKKGLSYVSRGGLKLEEALDIFGISAKGKVAADLGASTGGFTDCLLKRGAKRVYAVDVSIAQLDWRLKRDPLVVPIEKNARYLEKADFPDKLDLVTADLSFISVLKVLPAIREFLGKGDLLCLLKPQFEAEKGSVGKKGVVRNPAQHEQILNSLLEKARELGFGVRGLIACSVQGQRGNKEFFVHWTFKENLLPLEKIKTLVWEVVYGSKD